VLLSGTVIAGALTASTGTAVAGTASPETGEPTQVPSLQTVPRITDGEVDALVQIGNTLIAGGTFQHVAPAGGAWPTNPPAQAYIVAFDATTGAITSAFAPKVDGAVTSLVPATDGTSLYLGGNFTHVNGVAQRGIARVALATGKSIAAFKPKLMDGFVNTIKLSNGRLLIGGTFTKIANTSANRGGLASLDPSTGALTTYLSIKLAGHHNSDTHPTGIKGPTGATKIDVTPDGSRLIVIGNFRTAAGLARDQVAMIDLTPAVKVDPAWAAPGYQLAGNYTKFDSWVRDVTFSPDGSYLVISSSGGISLPGLVADAAARFPTISLGLKMNPTWVAQSGMDSLESVSITDSAVYVGGHQRWMNNPQGFNYASAGSVPRPGIAALDPVNGLPLAWNPGRNPRGVGAKAVLPTAAGVWVGSDTDFYGVNPQKNTAFVYHTGRLAFFPYKGTQVTQPVPGTLPGTVYVPSGSDLYSRTFDGTTAGSPTLVPASGLDWSTVRAAFELGGVLYFTDGASFFSAPFDGSSVGTPTAVNPYSSAWDTIADGSGGTYKGVATSFYSELNSVTGMAYSSGRLFYTLAGSPALHYRWFEPDDGVVGEGESTISLSALASSHGLIISGGSLYFANTSTGQLQTVAFDPGTSNNPGTPKITSTPAPAGSNTDWTSTVLFLGG
jgi:hypothetical protein